MAALLDVMSRNWWLYFIFAVLFGALLVVFSLRIRSLWEIVRPAPCDAAGPAADGDAG